MSSSGGTINVDSEEFWNFQIEPREVKRPKESRTQGTEPKLSAEDKQRMEEQSFTNMCVYYKDILLEVHKTGKSPHKIEECIRWNDFTQKLTRYGLIEKTREKVKGKPFFKIRYILTEKAKEALGV